MSFNEVINQLVLCGVFLIIGFFIREKVTILQKWFIPSAIIGGLVALILGPQVTGVISEMPASFSAYANSLIRVIMACMTLGVTIKKEKIISTGDYILLQHTTWAWQGGLLLALGALLSTIWPDLPHGWGIEGIGSFFGGHGSAASIGAAMDEAVGFETGITDIGMVLSTFGMVFAMTVGMVVVNWGIRKGYSTHVREIAKQPKEFYSGILPQEKRRPIGYNTTSTQGITPLALQLGLLLLAMWIGEKVVDLVSVPVPILSKIPQLAEGVIGALILTPIMNALKLDGYIDHKSISQISGVCLDVLLVGAIATLNLKLVATYFVPLLIFTAVGCGLTVLWSLWFAKTTCETEWFEKALFCMGMNTGAMQTGLALVRAADPNSESVVYEAQGINSGVVFWKSTYSVLVGVAVASSASALWTNVAVFLLGWFLLPAVFSLVFFGGRKKRLAAQKK